MKLLSSSPSISSSSSSVSFDPKICTPKSATTGCLSGILRRMLCSRTLPTHPSDHITVANSVTCFNNKQEQLDDTFKVTPGIVARLMGLDELHPNSITRSRSLNSADYKQDTASVHGKHRRVNSTLSLRDMPTYFELENEEFFVLSFDKGSGKKDQRSKEKKCRDKENRVEKKKKDDDDDEQANKRVLNVLDEEKLNRRIADKSIEEIAKCREINDLCLDKKGSVDDGAKLRKKRRKLHQPGTQSVELTECSSSEDSSPVSVLVFDQFIIDHDVPASEGDSKRTEGLSPRRKLSPDLENYGCKSTCSDANLMENNNEVKNLESSKRDWNSEKNFEVFDAVCRVIEAEVAKSSWLSSNNEEFEVVTADFGSRILDQMLDELVIQLSGILTL